MKVFVFNTEKCNGCFSCQIACKDEHCGNDWMPYTKAQQEIGQFWCKGTQKVHGQVPKVKIEYKIEMCNHCDNPACMAYAPDAVRKRDDGLVIIDPVASKGMRGLVDACPYGAIYWNDELQIPQKCTGCAHLVDAGEKPRCVDACQTGALRFGEEGEFADELANATVADNDPKTKPRVYYVNSPKLFIAGDVWDPEADEIIEQAEILLVSSCGKIFRTNTDDLGDFWFRDLEAGTYSITVDADGFEPVKHEGIKLNESLNVGDFALSRKTY